jgi:hypothetical protein
MEVANFKRNIPEFFCLEPHILHLNLANYVAFSSCNSYGLRDARNIFFRRHTAYTFKGEVTINSFFFFMSLFFCLLYCLSFFKSPLSSSYFSVIALLFHTFFLCSYLPLPHSLPTFSYRPTNTLTVGSLHS